MTGHFHDAAHSYSKPVCSEDSTRCGSSIARQGCFLQEQWQHSYKYVHTAYTKNQHTLNLMEWWTTLAQVSVCKCKTKATQARHDLFFFVVSCSSVLIPHDKKLKTFIGTQNLPLATDPLQKWSIQRSMEVHFPIYCPSPHYTS